MSINWKDFILRSLMAIIGITLVSFGAALSQTMSMGLDPFTALNTGASELLGFSLGNYQVVVNTLILVVVFFMKRSLIGWGTFYNMILVGYQIEFFTGLLGGMTEGMDLSFMIRILVTVVAIAIFTLGVAIYTEPDLGAAPYDAIAPILVDKTGWDYKYCRIAQDLLIILGAWLVGGPIGASTFITGFMAGPLIKFFSSKVSKPLLERFVEE